MIQQETRLQVADNSEVVGNKNVNEFHFSFALYSKKGRKYNRRDDIDKQSENFHI